MHASVCLCFLSSFKGNKTHITGIFKSNCQIHKIFLYLTAMFEDKFYKFLGLHLSCQHCCLLVQSCTSMYGNGCICFLKPWGATQGLYHLGRRNYEPSSIWFVFFYSFEAMKEKRDQKTLNSMLKQNKTKPQAIKLIERPPFIACVVLSQVEKY